ncbi:MAG: beta-lactamase family protein [Actinomycetales bacterium]|nr:beta-lactamase family protein [Actinomycetales bacterium]
MTLGLVGEWEVPHVGVTVVGPDGVLDRHGDVERPFRIASVTKLLTAYAVLIATEEGALALDEPAGPPGASVRHLLSHTAGYGFGAGAPVIARPGTRRIYSNRGFDVLAAHLERSTGITFTTYLTEAVLDPLGMTATTLAGSAAFDTVSTVADLGRFAAELLTPRLVARRTADELVTVQFPGLGGILPGVGRFDPLDWGLGVERNFGRRGHWAGPALSRDAFGHFGAAGTLLWVDPRARLACVCLTDRDFGPWALAAWPGLGEQVLGRYGRDVATVA